MERSLDLACACLGAHAGADDGAGRRGRGGGLRGGGSGAGRHWGVGGLGGGVVGARLGGWCRRGVDRGWCGVGDAGWHSAEVDVHSASQDRCGCIQVVPCTASNRDQHSVCHDCSPHALRSIDALYKLVGDQH